MNTIQDLRASLGQHAGDVPDSAASARVTAVRARAGRVRRRQAGVVAASAAVVVTGVAAVSMLSGETSPAPVDAPTTFTSLGWTYERSETDRTSGDRLEIELESSELPRLISWATAGDDQAVEVTLPGEETWVSTAADFEDFVWVPPNSSGAVTVAGDRGLEAAVYELDGSRVPPGVGSGTSIFREDVAGYDLVGAAVGELGQADLVVPVEADRGTLWLSNLCEQLPPRGYQVRISVVGEPGGFSSGPGCADGSGFDPGGSPNVGTPGQWGPGAALRIRVTTRDGEPVADGAVPNLRLGLAAYRPVGERLIAAGHRFPSTIEYGGKVWRAMDPVVGGGSRLPRLTVPEGGQHLVSTWVAVKGQAKFTITVDGSSTGHFWATSISGSGTGNFLVGSGQDVGLEIRGAEADVVGAALVLYRRVS